jgi:hypothetical protein
MESAKSGIGEPRMADELAALRARMAALEKSNRRICMGLIGTTVLTVALIASSQLWHPSPVAAQGRTDPTVPAVVKARSFQLVNAAGRKRATLGIEDGDLPYLQLIDNGGNSRVLIDQTGIWFGDTSGMSRVGLYLKPEGEAGVQINGSGGVRALMSVLNDSASVQFNDSAGKMRFNAGTVAVGTPSLNLYDAAGMKRAALGGVALEAEKTGDQEIRPESSLVLFDKSGKVLGRTP